jgi:hypothetical protein
MAATSDGRASTRGAGQSEELCEHGSPPAVLPRRRVSGRAGLRRALNLSRDPRAGLQLKTYCPLSLTGLCESGRNQAAKAEMLLAP